MIKKILAKFRKKEPDAFDAFYDLYKKECELRQDGWINWCERPPFYIDTVYARRTWDEQISILSPQELNPAFNVANLWWIPHRHEIEAIDRKLIH